MRGYETAPKFGLMREPLLFYSNLSIYNFYFTRFRVFNTLRRGVPRGPVVATLAWTELVFAMSGGQLTRKSQHIARGFVHIQ